MTVNPKKLRPYDQPPKRRRKLIPDGPDSAATGFFIAAALWLAVATALGALAIGLRLVTFELSFPLLFGYSFELDQRRVEYAFVNATVYGWLTNAGFAAVAFMTPRLLGRRMAMEAGLVGAFAIWNMSLAGGITALYVFDLGPNAPLSALLWLFDGGLAFGALLVTIAFLVTAAASLRTSYVGLWFAAVALLSIAGLTGLNALIGLVELFVDLPELLVALTSVFVERAISVMWLLGIAYATLHYVVPRAAGQPLASAGLGWLSFLPGSCWRPRRPGDARRREHPVRDHQPRPRRRHAPPGAGRTDRRQSRPDAAAAGGPSSSVLVRSRSPPSRWPSCSR